MTLKWTALLGIGILLLLVGCGGIEDKVIRGVNGYCATVSELERTAIRARVNAALVPHKIVVQCAQDELSE